MRQSRIARGLRAAHILTPLLCLISVAWAEEPTISTFEDAGLRFQYPGELEAPAVEADNEGVNIELGGDTFFLNVLCSEIYGSSMTFEAHKSVLLETDGFESSKKVAMNLERGLTQSCEKISLSKHDGRTLEGHEGAWSKWLCVIRKDASYGGASNCVASFATTENSDAPPVLVLLLDTVEFD